MKAQNILATIGNTPHIRVNRLYPPEYEVWVKMEKANPGGSIKDRIALSMVEDAEKRGILKPGSVIIEPTSGNTGIGLALVAAVKGYRLILTMPESMTMERRKVLIALGAELVLTPREKGMKGSIAKAEELSAEIEKSWIPFQFSNPANIEVHREKTAMEIVKDFPEGFDYLITGVGTGGHISGVAEVLKKKFPKIKVFAVEPTDSPVIGGGQPGPHKIQGIGAGFIPDNLKTGLLDGTVPVTNEEAYEYAKKAAKLEGLFVGISSGASFAAVAKKIKELPFGSRILTFSYDHGERYLSVEGLY
ncbi:MAG TPA: cysteine synthase A [Mariniphaga anaerophila]|uniref:Cysteine synthase n=1 Tax=Mariniphaga anaerophila TaxID=1484053 RepID=A0A831PK42_9BACT|nr:cysteine synthase A [Mariniphaga anaerophila]